MKTWQDELYLRYCRNEIQTDSDIEDFRDEFGIPFNDIFALVLEWDRKRFES